MNSISLESPILRAFRSMEDTLKNFFEKSLKKLLTYEDMFDIIYLAPERAQGRLKKRKNKFKKVVDK